MNKPLIEVQIDCVNGDIYTLIALDSGAEGALRFLEKMDHEGSAVSLHVDGRRYLDHDAYDKLKKLVEESKA